MLGAEGNDAITIEDSKFISCCAKKGGGAISLIVQGGPATNNQSTNSDSTLLTVLRSEFRDNHSPTGGSAVGLVSNARIDQVSFVNRFQDW